MSTPTPDGVCGSDIPEEDGFVAAGGDEPVILLVDVNGEDFVTVRGVLVDEASGGSGGCDGGFGGVEEPDCAVGTAGQDVLLRPGRVGHGMHDAVVAGQAGDGRVGQGRIRHGQLEAILG